VKYIPGDKGNIFGDYGKSFDVVGPLIGLNIALFPNFESFENSLTSCWRLLKCVMRDHIAPACAALNMPRASWLTFRRTFATWADQQGVSAKQRGELMGNSAETNAGWVN